MSAIECCNVIFQKLKSVRCKAIISAFFASSKLHCLLLSEFVAEVSDAAQYIAGTVRLSLPVNFSRRALALVEPSFKTYVLHTMRRVLHTMRRDGAGVNFSKLASSEFGRIQLSRIRKFG